MTKDLIRYDLLVQDALKGVVRKVLGDAAREGLSGDHHFYVSFRTDFPGVRLSARMREKYPQEMTIVLQHQFWDLGTTEHTFEVGLSFSGVPERLLVPFDALTGFFDPSVQFGLKFEVREAENEAANAGPVPPRETERGARSEWAKLPSRGAGSEPAELEPRARSTKGSVPKVPAAKLPAPKDAGLKDAGLKDAEREDPESKDAAPGGSDSETRAAKNDSAKVPALKGAAKSGLKPGKPPKDAEQADTKTLPAGADVVSLDSFRKKT